MFNLVATIARQFLSFNSLSLIDWSKPYQDIIESVDTNTTPIAYLPS